MSYQLHKVKGYRHTDRPTYPHTDRHVQSNMPLLFKRGGGINIALCKRDGITDRQMDGRFNYYKSPADLRGRGIKNQLTHAWPSLPGSIQCANGPRIRNRFPNQESSDHESASMSRVATQVAWLTKPDQSGSIHLKLEPEPVINCIITTLNSGSVGVSGRGAMTYVQ